MAAGSVIVFSKNKDDIRLNDLTGATIKMALIKSTWTPDATITGNSLLADVSAQEIAAGNGYSAGGVALASPTITGITGGHKFTTGNAVWTATGGSIPVWRYGLIYVSGTLWGMTNPLLGYFLGDSTPADVPATTDTNTLTIAVPANGWFNVT